ncbi:hypothetical protein SKAU_G00215730 [Synaphobranchus kaupii]|uniref:Uncharacterized protein n=1 Tax=Synaphobranchus kaupii TaxID=118154 RepID=A0A9Q1FAD2_SYNKA|nr:hypothetical protein SKAU_G00215730 [Synaphobranchus kaupii]
MENSPIGPDQSILMEQLTFPRGLAPCGYFWCPCQTVSYKHCERKVSLWWISSSDTVMIHFFFNKRKCAVSHDTEHQYYTTKIDVRLLAVMHCALIYDT